MAVVQWYGDIIHADPLEETCNGWLMRAKSHSARTSPGAIILVKQGEILEMAAAEMPEDPGLAELQAAMAEERKTLPSPADVIRKYQRSEAEKRAQQHG